MKKIFLIFLLFFGFATTTQAIEANYCNDNYSEATRAKIVRAKFNKERALLYNYLLLDKEQRKAAAEYDAETLELAFDELLQSELALCELKCATSCDAKKSKIRSCKRNAKKCSKDAYKVVRSRAKGFERILNRTQRGKYHDWIHQKRINVCPY